MLQRLQRFGECCDTPVPVNSRVRPSTMAVIAESHRFRSALMHARTRVAGVLACGALAATACSEPMSTASMTSRSASAAQVAADASPSQLAVAQAVPGFGGYYIDANGAPTVLLTAQGDRDAAAQALDGFLASYGWTSADLQVREAQYDYLQLNAWYLAARDNALGVSGAVLGDIDEVNNRITFGALDASALSSIAN